MANNHPVDIADGENFIHGGLTVADLILRLKQYPEDLKVIARMINDNGDSVEHPVTDWIELDDMDDPTELYLSAYFPPSEQPS